MGFTIEEYVAYNLGENDPNNYISEYERMMARRNIEYKEIFDNKVLFYLLAKDHIRMNKKYCYSDCWGK